LTSRSLIIFLALLLLTAGYSYYNHEKLYRFYTKKYFEISGKSDNYLTKSKKLYHDGRHEELNDFIETLMFINPDDYKLKQIAGLNYIKLGREIEGAELFASTLQAGVEDGREIPNVVRILFRNDHFGDVVSFFDRGVMINDVNMSFYYGASLYLAGRYNESIDRLKHAQFNGFTGSEISYYMALNMEQTGNLTAAASYMESAYSQNRRDTGIRLSLIRIYRKSGRLKEAEVLFRSR